MLVHPDDTLTRPRRGGPLRAIPFEQRFAATVLGSFAVALVMLGVLFARTSETATSTPDLPAVAPSALDQGPVSATATSP